MILVSLVLVVVAAVTLGIGFFRSEDLTFIYIAIAAALGAGVFLLLGILRGRPARRPVAAAAGPGPAADLLVGREDDPLAVPVMSSPSVADETIADDHAAFAPPATAAQPAPAATAGPWGPPVASPNPAAAPPTPGPPPPAAPRAVIPPPPPTSG